MLPSFCFHRSFDTFSSFRRAQVEVFPYQCSPLSTSAGIEQAFASAQRYRREAEGTVVVVLLDEVRAPGDSPRHPKGEA